MTEKPLKPHLRKLCGAWVCEGRIRPCADPLSWSPRFSSDLGAYMAETPAAAYQGFMKHWYLRELERRRLASISENSIGLGKFPFGARQC